ncbi:MAG: ABC transporter permease [Bacteroidales bacterium]|nr:ABC transporter permease [Bacteroidales bacterium]
MTLLQHLMPRQRSFVANAAKGAQSESPRALFWRRFRRNKPAMVSGVALALMAIMALLGYLITPDSTPWCNQQYLELATMKPGSRMRFAYIDDGREVEPCSLLHKMIYGKPLEYKAIPVYSARQTDNAWELETYTGSEPNDGEILTVSNTQLKKLEQRTFWLGTDSYGRDVLSQIMIGSRVSLSVGLIAVAIALLIGILLGSLAAYYGGWIDNVIMWFINVVWSIPTVLLVVAITFALGKGFWQVFIAVGLTMWVDVARVVRGQVLSIKEKEYIEATRAMGFRTGRIILRHILPNIVGPVIVITASNFASAILLEAGLSFLGIGVQPPMPSWGTMVKENYGQILLDSAYLAFIPGIAIMITVLIFMLLGNGVRDAMDVKSK